MERWIAIILGLLVIVIGFVIVQNIMDGQNQLVDSGNSFECALAGGVCTQESCAEPLDTACPGEQTCCARRG